MGFLWTFSRFFLKSHLVPVESPGSIGSNRTRCSHISMYQPCRLASIPFTAWQMPKIQFDFWSQNSLRIKQTVGSLIKNFSCDFATRTSKIFHTESEKSSERVSVKCFDVSQLSTGRSVCVSVRKCWAARSLFVAVFVLYGKKAVKCSSIFALLHYGGFLVNLRALIAQINGDKSARRMEFLRIFARNSVNSKGGRIYVSDLLARNIQISRDQVKS